MDKWKSKFSKILTSRWIPWTLLGFTIFVVVLLILWRPDWSAVLPKAGLVGLWLLAVFALIIASMAVNRMRALVDERSLMEERLNDTENQLEESYRRMESLFHVSQKFVGASDENQVIEPVLRLLVEISGASGAAFVPMDEHGQPQSALSHGELPFPVMDAWLDYLTAAEVRDRCRDCQMREPLKLPGDCPLLTGPFAASKGLICLSVRRGEREFGVLNLFLPRPGTIEPRTRILIQALLDETAMGLEGVYLRRRELSALRQLQFLRQQSDLTTLLNSLLGNVYRTLGADFAVLVASPSGSLLQGINLIEGDLPEQARPFVYGLLQGVTASQEPVLLGDLAGDPEGDPEARPFLKSLVAAPLLTNEHEVLGAILVGNNHSNMRRTGRGFQPRQLALLQTIAGQVALVVQNARLMAELEYQTMLQERARLAREIHDGLAQTIGFLKLQAAQLRNYISQSDWEKALSSADIVYATLTEAYQDARQAIDGLRISPDDCGLQGWLAQIAEEFQELSGLSVRLEDVSPTLQVSPEIQAQMIRIVQEALSNVRKHSNARSVWIACRENDSSLILEVRDDGIGFTPEDVISASRHGLRGMRERAELIGADFQVISRPYEGTAIRVRLPLKRAEETGI